jgi:hypothetical protein
MFYLKINLRLKSCFSNSTDDTPMLTADCDLQAQRPSAANEND